MNPCLRDWKIYSCIHWKMEPRPTVTPQGCLQCAFRSLPLHTCTRTLILQMSLCGNAVTITYLGITLLIPWDNSALTNVPSELGNWLFCLPTNAELSTATVSNLLTFSKKLPQGSPMPSPAIGMLDYISVYGSLYLPLNFFSSSILDVSATVARRVTLTHLLIQGDTLLYACYPLSWYALYTC